MRHIFTGVAVLPGELYAAPNILSFIVFKSCTLELEYNSKICLAFKMILNLN